jgi:hypothetical protein
LKGDKQRQRENLKHYYRERERRRDERRKEKN